MKIRLIGVPFYFSFEAEHDVPQMIHFSGLSVVALIELSMWMRALTAQAQRRNY
jgi:hypothetical protein